MQNLPHHRTEIAYRVRPSKAKAFVGTHAGTETIHRIVSICRQIALFEPRNYTTIKKTPFKNGVFFYGADDEARTRYLNLGKVALYRVSYIRKCKSNYTQSMYLCQDFFRKKYNYLVVYNIIIF